MIGAHLDSETTLTEERTFGRKYGGAAVGALAANVVAPVLVYMYGYFAGIARPGFGPAPAGPVLVGTEGGVIAIFWLFVIYVGSFGLMPIAISVFGAGIGMAWYQVRQQRSADKKKKAENDGQASDQSQTD